MVEELTAREWDILKLIAKGLTTRQVADALVLSNKTVETRLTGIYEKLGVTNRTEAAGWYMTNFSAHRARKLPPGNLPLRHREFLGYEAEIARTIEGLTSHHPLTTIEGLDGTGKTWLAIEVGYRCCLLPHNEFETVVWFSTQSQPEQTLWMEEVLNTLVRTLGRPDLLLKPMEEKEVEIAKLLSQYSILIIIDNYETIQDLKLDNWVQGIPEPSKILITSRITQPQFLDIAWRVHLKGLQPPKVFEFIRFHGQRLNLSRRALATNEELMPLVQVTGGNPNIIKMALGYTSYVGGDFSEAVAHVTERRRMWARKWDTLTEEARCLLMVMPFFVDSASSQALAVTAGLDGDQRIRGLEQLIGMHLVNMDVQEKEAEIRYSIHPVVRSFASSKLKDAPQFESEARERWSAYYLSFTRHHLARGTARQRYWNSLVPTGLKPVDEEWTNLRQVLVWADAHGQDAILLELFILLVHFMNKVGYALERLNFGWKAIEAANRLGLKVEEALLRLDTLAWVLTSEARFHEAIEEIKKGIVLADDLDSNESEELKALAMSVLARVYLEQDNFAAASECISKAMVATYSAPTRSRIFMAAGNIAFRKGNYPEAIQAYEDAISYIEQFHKENAHINNTNYLLGRAYLLSGELDKAALEFGNMLVALGEDKTIEVVRAKYGLACVAKLRREYAIADKLAQEAHLLLSEMVSKSSLLSELEMFRLELARTQTS